MTRLLPPPLPEIRPHRLLGAVGRIMQPAPRRRPRSFAIALASSRCCRGTIRDQSPWLRTCPSAAPSSAAVEFDLDGVCGEAADDQALAGVQARIGRTMPAPRGFEKSRSCLRVVVRPVPGRRHQCLGLSDQMSASPGGERNEARSAEAADAGRRRRKSKRARAFRIARLQKSASCRAGMRLAVLSFWIFFQNFLRSSSVVPTNSRIHVSCSSSSVGRGPSMPRR